MGAKFKTIFALLSVACAVQTTCKVDDMVARMPLALNEDSAGNEESGATEVTSGSEQEKLSFPHGGAQANGTASVTETHRQTEGQAEQANTTQPSAVTPVVEGAEVAQLQGEGTLYDNDIAQSSLAESSQFRSGMKQPVCQGKGPLPEAGEPCCKEFHYSPTTDYVCNTVEWCIKACGTVLVAEATWKSYAKYGIDPTCRSDCESLPTYRTDLRCLQEFGLTAGTKLDKTPIRQHYCCPPGQRYRANWLQRGGACVDDPKIASGEGTIKQPYIPVDVPTGGLGFEYLQGIASYDLLGRLKAAFPGAASGNGAQ